jgi:hypothetical protein
MANIKVKEEHQAEVKGKTRGPNFSNASAKLEDKAKDDLRKVKGTFRIYESGREGSCEKIICRKYHPDIAPMFKETMWDGHEYEIPLYVARFLNGIDNNAESVDGKIHTCSYPTHGWKVDQGGTMKISELGFGETPNPHLFVEKRTRRFGFESLEFASSC